MAETENTIIYAELRAKLDAFGKDIKQIDAMLRTIPKKAEAASNETGGIFSRLGNKIKGFADNGINKFAGMAKAMKVAFAAAPLVGALLVVGKAIKKVYQESVEANIKYREEVKKLEVLINQTGAASWTSTRQMTDMARQLSIETGKAKNEIMAMQAVLLKFGSITGEVFERAQKAVIDLTAAIGGNLESTARLLGRALEEPENAISMLSRQGIILTQVEKDLINEAREAGNVYEAQNVILKTLEQTYGGLAAAIDSVDMGSAIANLKEENKQLQGELLAGTHGFFQRIRHGFLEAKNERLQAQLELKRAMDFDPGPALEAIKNAEARLTKLMTEGATQAEINKQKALVVNMRLNLNKEEIEAELVKAKHALENYIQVYAESGRVIDEVNDAHYQALVKNLEALEEENQKLERRMGRHAAQAAEAEKAYKAEQAEIEKLIEYEKKLEEAEQARILALAEIQALVEAGTITVNEASRRRAQAYQAEANAVATVIGLTQTLRVTQEGSAQAQEALLSRLNGSIQTATGNMNRAGGASAASARRTVNDLYADLTKIENDKTRELAELRNARERGLIQDEEQFNRDRIRIIENAARRASNLQAEFGITERNVITMGRMNALFNDATEEVKAYREALADDHIEKMKDDLEMLGMSTRQLMARERERELEYLRGTDEYKGASKDQQKEMEELLAKTQKMRENPFKNWQAGLQELSKYSAQAVQAVGAVYGAIAAIRVRDSEELIAKLEKDYEETRKIKDQEYADLMEDIEKRHQAALYEAGLISGVTEEQIALDLERAKQTGNERLMLETKNKLKQKQIDDKFAAEQKAAEEKKKKEDEEREKAKNQKKAELEYEAAMATYQQAIIQAALNAAMGLGAAVAANPPPWGIPMWALATTTGAAQVVAAKAAKPKMQTFAHGGIVAGNSFSGDSNLVRANSGERLVTQKQQERMTDILDGKSTPGQNIVITIPLHMDSRIVAEEVVRLINNGEYQIVGDRALV